MLPQSYGDDLNDGRNIDRPVQTIATALTIASSIGVDCTVSILDDQIYTEGWLRHLDLKLIYGLQMLILI
jgi:hypothetical protein